jgi:hypothetical protein
VESIEERRLLSFDRLREITTQTTIHPAIVTKRKETTHHLAEEELDEVSLELADVEVEVASEMAVEVDEPCLTAVAVVVVTTALLAPLVVATPLEPSTSRKSLQSRQGEISSMRFKLRW